VTRQRLLVAGIGNIFLGDDAFGVEVVRRLAHRPLPEGVRVTDFGIRGFDLACALVDGYDGAILVDAVRRGGAPGTLYVLELTGDAPGVVSADGHRLDPASALRLAHALGQLPARLRLVGCEPSRLVAAEDEATGLSPAVAAAVEHAMRLVESVLVELGTLPSGGTRGTP
jgi:hydrogenase maturation protease